MSVLLIETTPHISFAFAFTTMRRGRNMETWNCTWVSLWLTVAWRVLAWNSTWHPWSGVSWRHLLVLLAREVLLGWIALLGRITLLGWITLLRWVTSLHLPRVAWHGLLRVAWNLLAWARVTLHGRVTWLLLRISGDLLAWSLDSYGDSYHCRDSNHCWDSNHSWNLLLSTGSTYDRS